MSDKRRIKSWIFNFVSILASLIVYYLIINSTENIAQSLFWDSIIIIIFTYLLVYIHELGHIVAGKLVGINIFSVVFGRGKTILNIKLFGIYFIFNLKPGGGSTYYGGFKRKINKPAYAFAIAGGILAQILATLPVVLFMDLNTNDFFGIHGIHVPLAYIIANLYTLLYTLLPSENASSTGFRMNDGLRLLKIPKMSKTELEAITGSSKIFEAIEALNNRRYAQAETLFEDCLNKFPPSAPMKINYAYCLSRQGKFEQAKKQLRELQTGEHDAATDALISNNLAWVEAIAGASDELQEAETLSARALQKGGLRPAYIGTRAAVLIALGRFDEGIKLYESIAFIKRPIHSEKNPIIRFLWLAYAYVKTDNREIARPYLKAIEGQHLEPDEQLLFNRLKSESSIFAMEIDNPKDL